MLDEIKKEREVFENEKKKDIFEMEQEKLKQKLEMEAVMANVAKMEQIVSLNVGGITDGFMVRRSILT